MMSPTKLILASILILVAACSESADQNKSVKEILHAVKSSISANEVEPSMTIGFVAGLVPNQRPENAPIIRELAANDQRRNRALTGISEPIPASLDFIEDQGAWYTPFNQPGMPSYYDLRNWHDKVRDPNQAGQ